MVTENILICTSIRVGVIILNQHRGLLNTLYDMQIEKGCLIYYYSVFVHNHDFEIVFSKTDDACLVFVVFYNNVYLLFIENYKFLLLVCLFG